MGLQRAKEAFPRTGQQERKKSTVAFLLTGNAGEGEKPSPPAKESYVERGRGSRKPPKGKGEREPPFPPAFVRDTTLFLKGGNLPSGKK